MQRFDSDSSLWRARSISNQRFTAISEAPLESLLLGTNAWTVYNDSCSDSQTYTREKQSFTVFNILSPRKGPSVLNTKNIVQLRHKLYTLKCFL